MNEEKQAIMIKFKRFYSTTLTSVKKFVLFLCNFKIGYLQESFCVNGLTKVKCIEYENVTLSIMYRTSEPHSKLYKIIIKEQSVL